MASSPRMAYEVVVNDPLDMALPLGVHLTTKGSTGQALVGVVEMTENAVVGVASSNTEQAKAWDGDEGEYWATHADHFDRSVAAYHRPFMAAATIERHDNVLNIGCGTGQTTRDAARAATAGSARGVDLSSKMIDLARQLAGR